VRHLSEEELVLHHFGDADRPAALEAHLEECAACREALASVRADLEAVRGPEPPERGADYGAEVWARVQPLLAASPRVASIEEARASRPSRSRWRQAWAPLALAASLVLAFLLGRHWPHAVPPPTVSAAARERILLVAVGDHLERSEMLLVELVNAGADGKAVDISTEQQWAEELVGANRLYRQTVARAGDPGVVSVLDELERLLVEVAHRPSSLSPAELDEIRQRIESRGLLFRVRVIETQVREKEKEKETPVPGGKVVS
jgi:anti-sigma factor RsiW